MCHSFLYSFLSLFIIFCSGLFAEANTIERDSFFVRVNIIPDVDRIRISADSAFRIYDSRNKLIFISDKPRDLFFEIIKGEPAKAVYRPVLREFSLGQHKKTKEMVKFVKEKYNLNAEVIEYGNKLIVSRREIFDNRKYLVTAGKYENIIEARAIRNKLPESLFSSIITEVVAQPEGTIKIDSMDNTLSENVKNFCKIVPDNEGDTLKVGVVQISQKGVIKSAGDIEYFGSIEICVGEDGKLGAINELPMDKYLYGVISSEIGGDAPLEALKAQAVCARANAVRNMAGFKHIGTRYDLCASVHCQFYAGRKTESANIDRAVEETKGEVPVYNGEIIDAVFHSNCGGHTEDNENVWSGSSLPYLRGIYDGEHPEGWEFPLANEGIKKWIEEPPKDTFCSASNSFFPDWIKKKSRWEKKFSGKELTLLVNKQYNIGQIKDLKVSKRGISGRIIELEITGELGSVVVEKELTIRRLLGGLNSSAFIMEMKKNGGLIESLVLRGAGNGHGAGMCQTGAWGMAKKGFKYQDILKKYYTGIDIEKIY